MIFFRKSSDDLSWREFYNLKERLDTMFRLIQATHDDVSALRNSIRPHETVSVTTTGSPYIISEERRQKAIAALTAKPKRKKKK